MEILGIDEFAKEKREDRSWRGVKEFYLQKVEEMKVLSDRKENVTNIDKLVSACAAKIVENMERQLSRMKLFSANVPEDILEKMEHAPLTNSGCESKMADLDVRVRFSGGSAPITTISDKQVISKNRFLLSSDFDGEGAGELFKWARTSAEAKKAMEIQDIFLERVKLTKHMAMKTKQIAKQRKIARAIKLLSECRKHGGPVCVENLSLLDTLNEIQVIAEVTYLKATIASEIKLRERVKEGEKYKMKKLPIEQLKVSIQNVLLPSKSKSDENINNLLGKFFENYNK